jgi:dGTPase
MPVQTRKDIERWERELLASYAAFSDQSKGRTYPQKEHPLRTAFQRDRDRIIHSAAFRRLEYKTQVFIPHERDHFRTRLTHTIEVAQIARTLARNLRLNEDLTEAIALVHDLGHTPFGHSGEDVLDELLSNSGGFNHNRQSLRIVDLLEQRYPEHPGLNLTYEVREGIARHETSISLDVKEFSQYQHPSLEASLVDIADEIAYNAHDIDDGLSSGILTFDLLKDSSLLNKLNITCDSSPGSVKGDQQRYTIVRRLIDVMATDVIDETQKKITKLQPATIEDVRHNQEKLCGYSSAMKEIVEDIKSFLAINLYRQPHLKVLSKRAHDIIELIFKRLTQNPELMPERFQEMLITEQLETVVADYIAGMTDRYAEKKYADLGGNTL